MKSQRQWLTCTPVRFKGDHSFFARDSGLLCKGFQEIGVDCKAIMPGPPMEDDQTADLIRTDYRNLEDADWWRSLGAEGVVFYGWGGGKYARIARAIKEAGLVLITHMDTGGILSVFNGIPEYAGSIWRVSKATHGKLMGCLYCAARLSYGMTVGVVRNDLGRARHLKTADVIGAISPIALARIQKACRAYGGEALAARVQHIPHPNGSYMQPDPKTSRRRLVVALGRWDDAKIKGTDLLLATLDNLCRQDSEVEIEIYGRSNLRMTEWHQALDEARRNRISLMGVVPNTSLRLAFGRARVSLCTSLTEGYHTVSAEALCCGCSVVGPDVPEIPSMKWFTDGPYGRMAKRNADALAEAVILELKAWDAGQRDPMAIGKHWGSMLHAPRVAERILKLTDELKSIDCRTDERRAVLG